ncbi:SspB family protein [Novispirillum itersonii]|uniref:SspB family protein n=1 Tax=Novispirillum itersonii TaxID=189 RepID=UPI00035D2F37|nr:ClpXP protease specificity-enhancing factor SspB [Novispirillum itersonii]
MDTPGIQYEMLVERALRGVLRDALRLVLTSGLPGQHHFYITFRTTHAGVAIPPRLKAQYPEEMTIVLQHQFWNLEVHEDWFAVELSFQNKAERLVVPFEAVTGFADPHAQFGLQFQGGLAADADLYDDEDFEDDEAFSDSASLFDADNGDDAGKGKETADTSDSKVVTLDAFRRK